MTIYYTGRDIVECDCQQYKDFVDENHGHVLTGGLRIITSSKLTKFVIKGSNFREAVSINWNKCKRELEIVLDSNIERIILTNPKVRTEDFVELKRKILQEVGNNIISLIQWIKVHKTNPVLKQDAVIEYLINCTKRMSLSRLTKLPTILSSFLKSTISLLFWKKLEFKTYEKWNETYEKTNENQKS